MLTGDSCNGMEFPIDWIQGVGLSWKYAPTLLDNWELNGCQPWNKMAISLVKLDVLASVLYVGINCLSHGG